MLQFVTRDADSAGLRSWVCARVPFRIGRANEAHMTLDAPGVWDSHAIVSRDRATGKLSIQSQGEAMLLVNGERVSSRILLPGDQVQIGAVCLNVALSPVVQTNLAVREGFVWALWLAVLIVEVLLIVGLK